MPFYLLSGTKQSALPGSHYDRHEPLAWRGWLEKTCMSVMFSTASVLSSSDDLHLQGEIIVLKTWINSCSKKCMVLVCKKDYRKFFCKCTSHVLIYRKRFIRECLRCNLFNLPRQSSNYTWMKSACCYNKLLKGLVIHGVTCQCLLWFGTCYFSSKWLDMTNWKSLLHYGQSFYDITTC